MADSLIKEIGVEDLYGFLGITSTSTDNEINKAYRKKALRFHPDKNPDSTSAAEMFQKLSRIYGVLTNPAAKAAYDKWLKIKERVKKRNEELSVKRRKLKDDLESRENDHYSSLQAEHEAREMMKSQIIKLREQNIEMLRRQEELLRSSLQDDSSDSDNHKNDVIIQATWKKELHDITVARLTDTFSKYGPVEDIVIRKNKAIVSFVKAQDAVNAIQNLSDVYKFKWIQGEPPLLASVGTESSNDDYEMQVLERLRKAQERKDKIYTDNDTSDSKRIHLVKDDKLL